MKITILNYRKYKNGKLSFRHYLPQFRTHWSVKLWYFTIFMDYGIRLDFRKGNIIDLLKNK